MTTSGTTLYQLTRNEIITSAAEALGVLADGQSLSATQVLRGAEYLNRWLTAHRPDFVISKRKTYSFSPTDGDSSYEIGIGKTLDTAYPTKLLQAWSIDTASSNESRIQMDVISDYNFNLLPLSTSSGQPIQITYQQLVNYGVLQIWPVPNSYVEDNVVVYISYEAPTEIFGASTDTLDLPEEWYEAVIRGVAALWAPAWGVPLLDRKELKAEAKEALEMAKEGAQENASFLIQPAMR